jgi:hypothetical protein
MSITWQSRCIRSLWAAVYVSMAGRRDAKGAGGSIYVSMVSRRMLEWSIYVNMAWTERVSLKSGGNNLL